MVENSRAQTSINHPENSRVQTSINHPEDIINIEISAKKAKENKFQSHIMQWNRDGGELETAR